MHLKEVKKNYRKDAFEGLNIIEVSKKLKRTTVRMYKKHVATNFVFKLSLHSKIKSLTYKKIFRSYKFLQNNAKILTNILLLICICTSN